ncbi:Flp pilus assembly protein CpaB [Caulobacter sp. Root655]|uniref:Flp pilus assembly protein CpaB n=1 Tax=Caulobacter sp. Root655 TaxID=1736578 RepID=UPI0006FA34A8|nr:Flp pilus assembly protein CpaB [Caulobacter sp. Root655]KRA66068.1 Flp pilus assembly protein CpaB [Caulobacter sp. Root655]
MNPLRVMIVLVAAVSAIGLAVVMQKAMGGKAPPAAVVQAPAAIDKPMTQVLVAKRDLVIGERLTAADVTWQAWPSDAINAAFITNGAAAPAPTKTTAKAAKAVGDVADGMIGGVTPEKAIEGAIVRDPILASEPITSRKIVRGGEGGYLSVVLSPGKRAMAVPVTSETAVGGFVLPGDRVDVLQTREGQSGGEGEAAAKTVVAETILQNVRVLALDQSTAAEKDAKTIVAATATLEVGPIEAEALARAKAAGPVTLILRAYTDLGGPSGLGVRSQASNVVRVNRGGQTSNIAVRP